jgi:hypothetical protein
MAKHSSHILELAKCGAALRLREPANELAVLLGAFPDLDDVFDGDDLPVSFIVRKGRAPCAHPAVRRQRPMSAAAKRAVGKRMKKYCAERRTERRTWVAIDFEVPLQ